MEIKKAKPDQLQQVKEFYYAVIDGIGDATDTVGWKKDIYPAPEFLRESIRNGELFIAEENGTVVGAMVMNHQCSEAYRKVRWLTCADDADVSVIHALAVLPSHRGNGYARQMVRHAVDYARRIRQKTIRLDVLQGNRNAEKLYSGMGFRKLHTVRMYYDDIGWAQFGLYEYPLYDA